MPVCFQNFIPLVSDQSKFQPLTSIKQKIVQRLLFTIKLFKFDYIYIDYVSAIVKVFF